MLLNLGCVLGRGVPGSNTRQTPNPWPGEITGQRPLAVGRGHRVVCLYRCSGG